MATAHPPARLDLPRTAPAVEAVAPARVLTWRDWVLTTDRQQRRYITRYLMGAVNCAGALIALELALWAGLEIRHPQAVHWLSLFGILVEVSFYVVLRSGLNNRFEDPSLTAYEINAAITFIAVGYWLAPLRGETYPLVLLIIVLMFGMFATTPKQLGRCCMWAMATMSAAFAAVTLEGADPSGAVVQIFHGALILAVLPTFYLLAAQLSRIRSRLRKRKNELEAALLRIEALATIDVLTGLLNRREMHNVLDRQEKMAARQGQGFCIGMIDIDFFKRVNDVHGHNAGDEVLRVFASKAKASLRETDVICRWGGEEFLVMMVDTDIALATVVLERVHAAMSQVSVTTSGGQQIKVSFSAGLARHRQGEPMDRTIERADRALYRAKSDGRNRTAIDQVEAVERSHAGI
ncbi:MAG: hypothetical protein RI907_2241 [Pseudomonadota bacterium]